MKWGVGNIEYFNGYDTIIRLSTLPLLHSQHYPSQNPCLWQVQVSPTLTLLKTFCFETLSDYLQHPNDSVEEGTYQDCGLEWHLPHCSWMYVLVRPCQLWMFYKSINTNLLCSKHHPHTKTYLFFPSFISLSSDALNS